uniref:Uncharacterized protein n=1 Tax=Arundo donax TaxID=35708 RepID=A0A0A9G257_ARUDO
MVALSREG